MNRKKKIREKLAKKAKRANAKKRPKNKAPYIAKADRAERQAAELNSETTVYTDASETPKAIPQAPSLTP